MGIDILFKIVMDAFAGGFVFFSVMKQLEWLKGTANGSRSVQFFFLLFNILFLILITLFLLSDLGYEIGDLSKRFLILAMAFTGMIFYTGKLFKH